MPPPRRAKPPARLWPRAGPAVPPAPAPVPPAPRSPPAPPAPSAATGAASAPARPMTRRLRRTRPTPPGTRRRRKRISRQWGKSRTRPGKRRDDKVSTPVRAVRGATLMEQAGKTPFCERPRNDGAHPGAQGSGCAGCQGQAFRLARADCGDAGARESRIAAPAARASGYTCPWHPTPAAATWWRGSRGNPPVGSRSAPFLARGRALFALTVLLSCLAVPSFAADAPPPKPEESVDRGLAYLARQQRTDGSISADL